VPQPKLVAEIVEALGKAFFAEMRDAVITGVGLGGQGPFSRLIERC